MENNLKTLQLFYAGVLADSVYHFNKAGILNLVTEEKRKQQALTAASQIKQLGISSPRELFRDFSNIFGCIKWEYSEDEEAASASGKFCLLCALAKKMQTAKPCYIYCINPIREMLKAMEPSYSLSVNETLWESNQCVFKVIRDR